MVETHSRQISKCIIQVKVSSRLQLNLITLLNRNSMLANLAKRILSLVMLFAVTLPVAMRKTGMGGVGDSNSNKVWFKADGGLFYQQ